MADDDTNLDLRMIDKYFELQAHYTKIYGPKAVVFMQNGKFYESYNTEFEGFNLQEIQEILQIRFAKKGKNTDKDDPRSKATMLGFPLVNLYNSLNLLTSNGYIIVLFEEKVIGYTKSSKPIIERYLSGIYTQGTHISDKQHDSNYLLAVYMVNEPQVKNLNLIAVGITLLDVCTGDSIIYETYSDNSDENFGLDELLRIIRGFKPTETIIYYKGSKNSKKDEIETIKRYLELDKINHYFYTWNGSQTDDPVKILTAEMFRINYQNDYLAPIFKLGKESISLNGAKSSIEVLHLENKPYVLISLIIMLKYITEHNISLLKNLSYPTYYSYNKHLILGNDAIQQLNVLDSNNLESYNKKIKSLFDVVNHTLTPMGKRLLRKNLVNPLSQEEKGTINQRYSMIHELLQNKLYTQIQSHLKNIYDLERYVRQMARGRISPYEFYRMDNFFNSVFSIVKIVRKNEVLSKLLPEKVVEEFNMFRTAYLDIYKMDKMQNYTLISDISESLFKTGYNSKIDQITKKIKYGKSLLKEVIIRLSSMIPDKKNTNKEKVTLNNTDKNYYFTVTKNNGKLLEAELGIIGALELNLPDDKILTIETIDIEFVPTKSRTKILIPDLNEYTADLDNYVLKLKKLMEKYFVRSVLKLYVSYYQMLNWVSKFIAEIDFLVSGAHVADSYYYCRPQILSEQSIPSYLRAKQLRHPIIERLRTETSYVPNDIELGNFENKNGILLYGINSCGKSSLMKSIGLAVILAQIGYYVPAESFIYEPYMAIYARITGNDNLFKGLSSFEVEMTELDSILIRTANNGPYTLVIGDEVCRGTNDTDAHSLVIPTIVRLNEMKASYIFSSHLHKLPLEPEIQALHNLRLFHLLVEYDEDLDCLVFNRKLVPGSGPKSYALVVARYIIRDKKFLHMAETIKNRLTGELSTIPIRKSKYNKSLMVKICSICSYYPTQPYHKDLESHHINFQSNCLDDGKIIGQEHLNKNELYNLVVLCRSCHENVHRGIITIHGYLDTSIGPILEYYVDVKSKINQSLKQIEIINKAHETKCLSQDSI
jgi:DNA mismatch repair protein MutS